MFKLIYTRQDGVARIFEIRSNGFLAQQDAERHNATNLMDSVWTVEPATLADLAAETCPLDFNDEAETAQLNTLRNDLMGAAHQREAFDRLAAKEAAK